jgi:hypothetical protein
MTFLSLLELYRYVQIRPCAPDTPIGFRLASCAIAGFFSQERLQGQQREVERVAYDARQRILSEEARIREMKAAAVKDAEERQRLMKELEGQLQQRQDAVAGGRVGGVWMVGGYMEMQS